MKKVIFILALIFSTALFSQTPITHSPPDDGGGGVDDMCNIWRVKTRTFWAPDASGYITLQTEKYCVYEPVPCEVCYENRLLPGGGMTVVRNPECNANFNCSTLMLRSFKQQQSVFSKIKSLFKKQS